VRNDIVVDAAIRRVLRKGAPDRGRELAERLSGLRVQPQHVLAEPSCPQEAAVEGANGPYGCGQGRNELLVGCRRLDEGVQDGDVGGHTPGGRRVEAITVLAD